MSRVRTVFLGSGGFGVPILHALASAPEVHLVAVVTAPPRSAGRGGRLLPTPIDDTAGTLDLVVIRPPRLRDAVAEVLALEPGLAVLADYGQIVPRPILDLVHGALNLHPSLLPRHRGASPVQATILAGDAVTGVTLMKMDEGLDTGPIVAQERWALSGTETAPELEEELSLRAAALAASSLRPWLAGEIAPRAQPEDGATMTRPLRRADGRLDPMKPATALERQVRAYQPWPGSYLDSGAGRIVVWHGVVRPAQSSAAPGSIVAVGRGIGLATADGVLELVEVQPAGGRRMGGADLVRGRPRLLETGVLGAPSASSPKER